MEETIYLIHFHDLIHLSSMLMEPIMRILEINIQKIQETNFNPVLTSKARKLLFSTSVSSPRIVPVSISPYILRRPLKFE